MEKDSQEMSGDDMQLGSSLGRLSRALRERPVTMLALGAGVGALMGAELLAAGLAGGAAILLLQRGELRMRVRHLVGDAREKIDEAREKIDEAREKISGAARPSSEHHA